MTKVHTVGFMIRLLWRENPTDQKGERKMSKVYDTAIEAENDAFMFCYNYETKSCQKCIDEYKQNLRLFLSGATTIAASSPQPKIELK